MYLLPLFENNFLQQYQESLREEQPEHGMTLGLAAFMKQSKDSLFSGPGIK